MPFQPVEYRIGTRIIYTSSAPCIDYEWQSPAGKKMCFERVAEEMKHLKVSGVVVLLEESEIQETYGGKLKSTYESFGFKVIHYPIRDHSIPRDMKSFSDLQSKLVEMTEKDQILVHCLGGLGRSGTVLAGLFITLGNDAEKAIQMVRVKNTRAVETEEQERFLRDYAGR